MGVQGAKPPETLGFCYRIRGADEGRSKRLKDEDKTSSESELGSRGRSPRIFLPFCHKKPCFELQSKGADEGRSKGFNDEMRSRSELGSRADSPWHGLEALVGVQGAKRPENFCTFVAGNLVLSCCRFICRFILYELCLRDAVLSSMN